MKQRHGRRIVGLVVLAWSGCGNENGARAPAHDAIGGTGGSELEVRGDDDHPIGGAGGESTLFGGNAGGGGSESADPSSDGGTAGQDSVGGMAGGVGGMGMAPVSRPEPGPFANYDELLACLENTSPQAKPMAGGIYQQVCGTITFEIEDQTANGWTPRTALAGYSGNSYYEWTGGTSLNHTGRGEMRFRMDVGDGGPFRIFIHNRHEHPDGTLENDAFTKFDNDQWVKTFTISQPREWNWNTAFHADGEPITQNVVRLGPGEHTWYISGRSDGFAVDRVTLIPILRGAQIEPSLDWPLSPTK